MEIEAVVFLETLVYSYGLYNISSHVIILLIIASLRVSDAT
jgi:hypothetical protein